MENYLLVNHIDYAIKDPCIGVHEDIMVYC